MNSKIFSISLTSALLTFLLSGCGDQPLFTELAENRIKVIIKGTYESNNPRSLNDSPISDDDSVYVYPGAAEDADPSVFMIDIAGLKVASGKFDQYFANYRETYSANLSDSEPFFNGAGFLYENDDVRPNFVWQSIQMYIRKMIFDNAKEYIPSGVNAWTYSEDIQVLFHENPVYGLNFNLFQTITYYDFLRDNYEDINRIFPLAIPIEDGFVFDYDEEEIVLEIRLVIKNFIERYEYEYDDSDSNRILRHFYALSDWLRDIKRNEVASGVMGGNLLGIGRYYVPGKTASITGTATDNRYVIAVKAGHTIDEYEFPVSERIRPTCDAPKLPRAPIMPTYETDYMEALLDYYLQYEAYKETYDDFVDCVDSGEYGAAWNTYDSTLNEFRIPPISTWCSDGSFTLTNVPIGEYIIYESDSDPGPGNLPDSFIQIGTAAIAEEDIGSSIFINQ